MIFLVLAAKTLAENRKALGRYAAHIDGIEVRVDHLTAPDREDWEGFFGGLSFPAILTIRKPRDGGKYAGSEAERKTLFLRLLGEGKFSYLDLEEDSNLPEIEAEARRRGVRIIRSLHDFAGVPSGLAERILRLPRRPDELPKAAVMPRSSRDFKRVVEAFLALEGKEKILLGMGEFGFPSRVLAPRLGSFLTFTSPDGAQIAPGLIDPETLAKVYRYRRQGKATKINGIIGNPILHSRSPFIHNSGYDRLGLDAVYVPFHIDSVKEFLETARLLGLGGFSVTVPFKEEVLPLCTWTEEAVRAIGACNTAVLEEGGLRGYNTDAEGFLVPLERLFGRRAGAEKAAAGKAGFLNGVRTTVIGAGGAARSVVYALGREGAEVLVFNRTPERAERLVRDLRESLGSRAGTLKVAGPDERGLEEMKGFRDLVVQTTTVGMHPKEDEDALPGYEFTGTETVYDIVYAPRETIFLKRAAKAGCRIVYGDEMLLNQAYRQFLLYTGKTYPAS